MMPLVLLLVLALVLLLLLLLRGVLLISSLLLVPLAFSFCRRLLVVLTLWVLALLRLGWHAIGVRRILPQCFVLLVL